MGNLFKFIINNAKRLLKLKIIIFVIIILIVVSGAAYVITLHYGTSDDSNPANTPGSVSKKMEESALNPANGSEIKTKASQNGGYALDIDLDVLTDEIIEDLKKHGGNLDVYFSGGHLHDYLKKMIKAEYITQYPDLRTVDKIGTTVPSNEFQGVIKIKRHKSDGTEQLLQYIPLGTEGSTDSNTLNGLIYSANLQIPDAKSKVLNYFSIDTEGNLIIANWSERITKNISGEYDTEYKSNDEEVDYSDTDKQYINSVAGEVSYQYSPYSVNYKSIISKYTMPFDYLWAFMVCGNDEEFINQFTDLALDSSIEIGIYDNLVESENQSIDAYNENGWESNRVVTRTVTNGTPGAETAGQWSQPEVKSTKHHYDVQYIKSYGNKIVTAVTNVDIWYMKYIAEYVYEVHDTGEKKDVTRMPGDEVKDPNDITTGMLYNYGETWKTTNMRYADPTIVGSRTIYKTVIAEQEKTDTAKQNQINQRAYTEFYHTIDYKYTLNGVPKVQEKTDNTLQPGDEGYPNFCTLYLHSENAKRNITGTESWLFEILQSNIDTVNMVDLTKYLIYCATGKNLGVTSMDFEIFKPSDFNTLSESGNDLLKEYIHHFEHATPPPTNTDGTKYIVETVNGNPTVGYGVDLVASGYGPVFTAAGYSITVGSEIDIDFVNSIEDEILNNKISSVKAITSGLNLTEYQINALVSRAYNCGVSGALSTKRNGKDFVEAFNEYWNAETDDQFEEKNSNANFTHKFYTLYMKEPTTSDGSYLSGLEGRRKSEWTLFQTGYYDVLGKWHSGSSSNSIVKKAKEIHEYMEANSYKYCVYGSNSLEECKGSEHGLNTTFEQSKTGHHNSCCATFVSWVLQECGYISDSEHLNGANALQNLLKSKGFTTITNEADLQPGDILCYNRHVEIYAGDNRIYNAGSGNAIRNSSPQSRSRSFDYALRAT